MSRWLLGACAVLLTLCSAPLAAQEPNWVLKSPTNSPRARGFPAMAYDAARGEVVMFGGTDGEGLLLNDTWVWDGTNWTQKFPVDSPPARNGHAMAYDAARGEVVLFGGNQNGLLNDTWVWDGTNWTRKIPANSPPARSFHAMAYDTARGEVVMVGGASFRVAAPSDTWIWDGTNWTQKFPVDSPSANSKRYYHAMAYDAARGEVVLFGGLDEVASIVNDTWVWDGTNWTQKFPVDSPGPLHTHAMAYDEVRRQVVVFGGGHASGGPVNDTWVWPGDPASSAGSISVTTNLPAATFNITGPTNYSGSGTSFTVNDTPAGTYTVTYSAVSCYATPPPETKTLTSGGVLTFSRAAYQGQARVSVNVAPAGATSATFSINPPVPGMPSNGPYPRVRSGVWPQAYTATFNSVTGFVPPVAAQTLTPDASCRLDFSGTYNPSVSSGMANLAVSSNIPTGSFRINGGALLTSLSLGTRPAGKVVVKYTPVSGYYTPTDQTVVLKPGDSLSLEGKYRRLFLIAFTGWNNSPTGFVCIPGFSLPGFGIQYAPGQILQAGSGLLGLLHSLSRPVDLFTPAKYSIIWPGLHAAGFTFYSTDEQGNQNGNACIAPNDYSDHREAWNLIASQNPPPTADDLVAVIGHSYGGHRAKSFVEQLRRGADRMIEGQDGIETDLLVTVDPIDWGRCELNLISFLSTGCVQLNDPDVVIANSPARAITSYYQTVGFQPPWGGSLYPLMGYAVPNATTTALVVGAGHTEIDDAPSVEAGIVDALAGLVKGPQLTTGLRGTATRTGALLNYPVRVKATGYGKATGVAITAASLNGVRSSNLNQLPNLGDLAAGESSGAVNLVFPGTASLSGRTVQLTVSGTYSYGLPFTNILRLVVP